MTTKRKHRLKDHRSSYMESPTKRGQQRKFGQNDAGYDISSKTNTKNGHTVILVCTMISIVYLLATIPPSHQQSLCPKACVCDLDTEVRCNGDLGANWMPHTLNPSLKRIIINHAGTNQISDQDLNYYSNLETLDIAFNKIVTLDFESIKMNSQLVLLNVSHNSITELKDTPVSAKLQSMQFDSSQLLTSNNEEDLLKSLKKVRLNVVELVLSHNQLKRLKDFTFMRLHKLQKLDLSHNQLTIIDTEALYGLNKLQALNLRGNQLLRVPTLALRNIVRGLGFSSSQSATSSLKTLDLGENLLTTIESNSFDTLERLQEMNLDSCIIQSIQDNAFVELKSLHVLALQNNAITDISQDAFVGLDNLKILNLSGNKFDHLTGKLFKSLFNLEELRLSNGSLNELNPSDFAGLLSLKRLNLDGNINLTKIPPGSLTSMPRLIYVSLYMNSITSLADDFTHHSLVVLDLRDNQLDCDCDLKWLTKWLINFNQTFIRATNMSSSANPTQTFIRDVSIMPTDPKLTGELLNLTCSKPPALVGARIIDLPLNGLECLHPSSEVNVHVGFACLFIIITILTTICTVNLCRDERRLLGLFKENLAQKRNQMMLYEAQDNAMQQHQHHIQANENLREETQLGCALYEPVDYSQDNTGPVYTIPNDSSNYLSQQQSHRL